MTNKLELYRCNVCGNIVEVVISGQGELVCCGENMEKLTPKTQDEMKEKHVPVFETTENGVIVKIGEFPHPMEEEHHIQFVEVISGDNKYVKRKYFMAGDEPILKIKCDCKNGLSAIEYCNIHGLWANKENEHE